MDTAFSDKLKMNFSNLAAGALLGTVAASSSPLLLGITIAGCAASLLTWSALNRAEDADKEEDARRQFSTQGFQRTQIGFFIDDTNSLKLF